MVELAVSLATTSILLAMGYGAFRQYAEAMTARKALGILELLLQWSIQGSSPHS